MKKPLLWSLVALVAIAMLALVGWQARRGWQTLNISEADRRALVLPVAALQDFGITPECSGTCERYDSQRTGTALEVSYEYDDSDNDESPLYISSLAMLDWNDLSALQNFWGYRGGFHLGMLGHGEEVQVEEVMDNPMTLGDRRYWARIRNGKKPVGELVLVQQGRIVLAYIVVGVHFDESSDLEDFLRPVVKKAAALQAEG
jgi:hypothetical protein